MRRRPLPTLTVGPRASSPVAAITDSGAVSWATAASDCAAQPFMQSMQDKRVSTLIAAPGSRLAAPCNNRAMPTHDWSKSIDRRQTPSDPSVAILCLVGAPADAAAYRQWARIAPDGVRIIAVEQLPMDVTALGLSASPYALVAAGAAATEAHRFLRARRGNHMPLRLVVVGASAPTDRADTGVPVTAVGARGDRVATPAAMAGWISTGSSGSAVRVLDAAPPPLVSAPGAVLNVVMEELRLTATLTAAQRDPAPSDHQARTDAVILENQAGNATAETAFGDIIGCLVRIPVAARRFAVTSDRAWREFRLSAALLEVAVAAGLPHLRRDSTLLLDHTDLTNLALCPGLHSPQRAVMRRWSEVLRRPPGEHRTYDVSYHAYCPAPGHVDECAFDIRLPGGAQARVYGDGDGRNPLITTRVRLDNDWPSLPPAAQELLADLSDIRFVRMPGPLRWDYQFVRRARMGDCAGICRLTVAEGRRRGLPIRATYGLIVAPPLASPHHWAEVRVDGRWVACDAGLRDALVRWGVLAPGAWPLDQPLAPLLASVSAPHHAAVRHGPFFARVSYRVNPSS